MRSQDTFHCSSDTAGAVSYAFNFAIAGKKTTRIKSPATTVLIYEGKGGKLEFKHGGKAGVAFVDGHVKMITEKEAKKLVWKS